MTDKLCIAIVEDDAEINTLLQTFLNQYGYKTLAYQNGRDFINVFNSEHSINFLILDIILPDMNGIEICKQVRKNNNMPIILLSGITHDFDRIMGLEYGADDYINKPFNPRELLARIRVISRRALGVPRDDLPELIDTKSIMEFNIPSSSAMLYEFAGWQLNTATRTLFSPSRNEVPLTSGIFDLLLLFVEHPQRILTRDHILDITKHRNAEPFDRSIDVQVSRLRQKLEENPQQPKLIKTIRSGGYFFAADVKIIK